MNVFGTFLNKKNRNSVYKGMTKDFIRIEEGKGTRPSLRVRFNLFTIRSRLNYKTLIQ